MSGQIIKFLIIILSVFSFLNISKAAEMPTYERLQPITYNVNAPTAVALDKYECLLVAESIKDRVLIYSQSGQYIDTISGLSRPISVAVDDNIRIFIGNKDSGNVEVYDADYNYLLKLGTGDGEFTQPNDIEIDSTGKIYVVDKGQNIVKIYNADGSYNFSFGSSGSGDGEFHSPTSIVINEGAGELIVLDRQLTLDMYGSLIEGARIQVFDMSGGYKRSFSRYGMEIGQMFRPQHLAVDGESRMYVTDSFHNVVLVYDSDGTHLGDIYNVDNPMRNPLGITMGNSNRLYIASLTTGKVEVYGIDPYTRMQVVPLNLVFQGQEGGSNPALQGVEIRNNGSEMLNWIANKNDSWITISGTGGTVQQTEFSTLNVGVNLSGLAVGTYTGSVSISAASGPMEVVNVGLTVLATPQLSVTPLSLTFTSTNGTGPSSQALSITNTGEGTLNWTAVSNRSWLSTDKATGIAPDTIAVSVDIRSMDVGTHTGAITITGQGALSSPAVIPVTLNMVELKGTIDVTTNLAEATFTINGPASYSSSGTSWTVTDAPVGTYAIVYGDVDGYTTPSSQGEELQADGTVTFHGEYTSTEGEGEQSIPDKNIIVGAGPGKRNTGVVKVFKSDGTETGVEFLAHGYNYGVNVAAGDIDKDGVDEIITAPGGSAENPAEIKIFDKDGNQLTNLNITAYQYKYGANVAAGDFNGDGYYEVVAGVGAGAGNPANVKVFVYDPTGQQMVDSGIDLLAYDTGYGVRVTAGDINGDGIDEIISVPGYGGTNEGIVKVWDVDTSLGVGQWSVSKSQEYTVSSRYRYSVSVASNDIDGDGYAEVVTGAGSHSKARDEIKIYDRNGDKVSEFKAYIAKRYGVNVAVGDMDNDGVGEIAVGAGPGSRNRAIVKIFDANGIELKRFKALRMRYGVNVAIGNLGL
jgi:sugar lactone lactonase YvrE